MEFKNIGKEELKNNVSYNIATTILNMRDGDFTQEDIVSKVKKKLNQNKIICNSDVDELTHDKLIMMRNYGLLIHHGRYFYLK